VAAPREIELSDGTIIPILYEDRSVLAIDKPAGWLLAPDSWDRASRNLQLALESSLSCRAYWARSRNLKFLRFIHRLDAGTSGVLLLAKSRGALQAYSNLFAKRQVEKVYLAVVHGVPRQARWNCSLEIVPDPTVKGRMSVIPNANSGQRGQRKSAIQKPQSATARQAETSFRVVQTGTETTLVEARPATGRTHQIRVHLAVTGHPVHGDTLYGQSNHGRKPGSLALRAILLSCRDPFTKRKVRIEAPFFEFARSFGFNVNRNELFPDAERQMI
jgi:23S rRNA pseudouridine1911/1915/1917 synthase